MSERRCSNESIKARIARIPGAIFVFSITFIFIVVFPLGFIFAAQLQKKIIRNVMQSNAEYFSYLISINDVAGINRHLKLLVSNANIESIALEGIQFSFRSNSNLISSSRSPRSIFRFEDLIRISVGNHLDNVKLEWYFNIDFVLVAQMILSGCISILLISALTAFLGKELSLLILEPFEQIEESFEKLNLENLRHDSTYSSWAEVGHLKGKFNLMIDRLKGQNDLRQQLIEFETRLQVGKQVAHDIKSPLSVLSILARKRVFIDTESQKILTNVSQRLNKIIDDLFMSERSEFTSFQISIFLNDIIGEKRIEFRDRFPELQIYLDLEEGALVLGNKSKLGRVFSNVLNNCAEAYGGKPGNIWVRSYTQRDKIVLSIKDEAGGIPHEMLTKINSGQSVTSKDGHFGIGLTYARAVIREMGAELKIDSLLGHGTEFIFIFNVVSV